MKKSLSKKCSIGIISTILVASFACLITLVFKQNKTNDRIDEALNELKINEGMYDTKSIVLTNTNKTKAEDIAKRLNAKLRINESGTYATLTLPENVDVKSIYENKENIDLLDDFSLNMYAKTSEIEEVTKEHLPRRPFYNSTINDDSYNKQTYLDYLNMKNTWNSYMGDNITVAIIDTGIDTDHSEFVGKISEYSYNATEDKIIKDYKDSNGNYDYSLIEDEVGHGTAVAGVIASSFNGTGIVGIAPNVNLLVIKAKCKPNGQFYRSSDLVFGLYYAIERNVDVVNMSFGGNSNVYKDAAKLAVDNDIICVAAAGNEATSSLTYPAADENVIGVGALANGSYELASYSNFGENTDLVAPGTVYTTSLNNSYKIMDGTSFASPIVAASIALLRQQNYKMEFKDVCELLYASSYDLGSKGKDYYYGYGALDLSALLLEERGTVTFDTLTDEVDDIKKVFIRNHTLQDIPEVERNYAVFDGWYYDINLIDELNYYNDIFSSDLTLYALWGNEDDVVPYTYVTLPDNTIEIRSYTGHRRYITIPNKIENKDVTSIGDFAFSGNSRIREVNLPNKLNNIGMQAFSDCSNLVSMTIPDGVKELGSYAFSNDSRLSEIIISDNSSLTKIGDFAFTNCNLFIFEVPKNVTYLNGSAFYGCRMLTSYNVKKGNQSFISDNGILYNKTRSILVAYPANKNDKEFKVLDKTSIIGPYAFACSKIENINLNKVSSIGNAAFINSSLVSLNILDSVKEIGELSFAYCYDLKELTIGHGLNNIPSGAFLYNTSLEGVVIPNNIQYILGGDFGAFEKCFVLKNVTFEDNSKLVLIDKSAFASCNLQNVSIPKNVVEIRDGAFSLNYNLNLVTFDKDSVLKSIGEKTFIYNYSLSNISLPNSLTNIGSFAFSETNLNEVTIPSSLTSFGEGAFASCNNLENIYVETNNKNYVSIDGVVYSKNKEILIEYPSGKKIYSYTINNSTKKIGGYAFYGSNNLSYIHLSENLEKIDEYAFAYVSNLSFINITDNVTLIGRYAFSYDYNLSSINFTNNSKLPRISFASFSNCGITSFTIPSNVSTISQYAFSGCDNLTQINFARNSKVDTIPSFMFDGCKSLNSIIFEEESNLKTIQAHGFANLNSLTTIDLSNTKVNSVGNYAFANCSNLTNITLNNNLTSIGRYAFYKCNNLLSIDIPSSVNYIGRYAFYSNGNIDVYFKGEVLPATLQENWDNGIKGYYVGIKDIITENDFQYAKLSNNKIALIKYTGNETTLDLTAISLNGNISQIGGYAFYNSPVKKIILPNTINSIERYAFAYSKIEEINIPSSVTFIGNNAFIKSNISKITFESNSNLERIEQYAFAFTSNLKVITLPRSLVSVGSYMFYESGLESINFEEEILLTNISKHMFSSSKITDIVIPNSVNYIDDNSFRDCTSLTNVVLSDVDNLQIHANAFYNTSLTTINIPSNVTYIGEYSLVGLRNLKAYNVSNDNLYYKDIDGVLFSKDGKKLIAYPANKEGSYIINKDVETIGFGAFENSSLSNVTFEDNINLLTIGYRAFYDSKKLKEITIPSSVVSIDYYAFANCESLESFSFEKDNKLTGIYEGAFYNCSKLSNIIIPDSIVEISDFAFYGCKSLTKLPISENNNLKGIYQYAFAYTGITTLVVPDSVIDIDNYAFAGSKLNKVYISNAKQKELVIGLGAFYDCNELKEITLPFIGKSFENDEISWLGYIFGAGSSEANNTYVPESLKKVTINEGISKIGVGGFNKCENLEIINIPHSVVYISRYAFYETTAMYELTNEIAFDDKFEDACFGKGISGELKIKNGITILPSFAKFKNLTYVSIPESITSIEPWTFEGCCNLKSINIPNSIIDIGDYAFSGCTSLKNIKIPENVTSIKNGIFKNCYNLEKVEIPTGVTSIGEYAFNNCTSLKNIIIPDKVFSIGECAFSGCSGLTSISIPNSVTNINAFAFSGCSSLKYVNLSQNVKEIGRLAFYSCTSLQSIDIEYVEQIGMQAFENCSNLISITLPEKLTIINERVFAECIGLKNIILNNSIQEIGEGAFYNCISISTLELPASILAIKENAFSNCNIYKIINKSDLKLEFNSYDNGSIACNASIIENKDGTISYSPEYNPDKIVVETSDGFRFVKENGIYKLTNYFGTNEEVQLPSLINGESYIISELNGVKKVIIPDGFTIISENAFKNSTILEEIVLPNTIKEIGEYAFSDCVNLKSINLPDSLQSIGTSAFSECRNLNSLFIGKNVEKINGSMFLNCTKLELSVSVNNKKYYCDNGLIFASNTKELVYVNSSIETELIIPSDTTIIGKCAASGKKFKKISFLSNANLSEIGGAAFRSCDLLESVDVPESVISIGAYAFGDCSNLKQVKLPKELKYIEPNLFINCKRLMKVDIGDSVKQISFSVFSGCSSLTSINLPDSLTEIMQCAFKGCSSLCEVVIPSSVEIMYNSVFEGCSSLESIIIPDKISVIDSSTFENCTNLKNIELPVGLKKIGIAAFANCESISEFFIPTNVSQIDADAFKNCINLTKISIPSEIASISSSTFEGCYNLKEINLPDTIQSIGNSAFKDCKSLLNINIPNELVYIGGLAFKNCQKICNISLPNTINEIGEEAFANCYALKNVNMPLLLTKIENELFANCENLNQIILNDGIIEIGDKSFINCKNLTTIVMPNSIIKLGDNVFDNCTSLVEANIPSNLEHIGIEVFNNCSSLKQIKINSKITKIESKTFYNCTSLENVVIEGDTIYSIGNNAFENCNSLTSLTIASPLKSIEDSAFEKCINLKNVQLPYSLENIGNYAFSDCCSLEKIDIPSNVNVIGNYAFSHCSNLCEINLPDNLLEISNGVFWYCYNLKKINIPNNVTSIGNSAFDNCTKLASIIIPASIISIEDNAFYQCSRLYEIRNLSELLLNFNSYENGMIAYYAKKIIEKNGSIRYLNDNQIEFIETNNQFRFMNEAGKYKLIAYFGDLETVILPSEINGKEYELYYFNGAKNVIIPSSFTEISDHAFSNSFDLENIEIPENVTTIGNYAFYDCTNLESVTIPQNVTLIKFDAFNYCIKLNNLKILAKSLEIYDDAFANCKNLSEICINSNSIRIGKRVFDDTAYCNDKVNWRNGLLLIDNNLIKVDKNIEYLSIPKEVKSISNDAFDECNMLKSVSILNSNTTFGVGIFSNTMTPNIETISICWTQKDWPISFTYFGYEMPITLKNVILLDGFEIVDTYQFVNLTDINIYVENSKEDTALWDVYYKGWNNGNKVYYKGEWINANFYDMNNNLISSDYYSVNTVIRQPYVKDVIKDNKKLVFVGWDINDDGIVDNIPATSTKNITAKAIMKEVDNIITVGYFDYDNNELYSQTYNYGDEIVLPTNNPTKKGYTFMGWDGYVENMTVTKDINLYSMWSHLNNGHEYVLTTISPTCETEGYDKYVCSICDHEYHTNIKSKLGHSYNDWIIDTNAACEDDGLRHHICSRCNYNEEEIIPALGHNYQVINKIPSTCTSEGNVEYQCSTCQNKTTETLSMANHNYVKKKVNKTWLQWLIERLLNIFFGYEGDEGFYYQCSECNHIQTIEERNSGSSALLTCEHELKDFETILDATCNNYGILGRYCIKCNKLIEAKTINRLDHNYNIVEVINPTCTEKGYTKHTCSLCNESYNDIYIESIGHAYEEWVEEVPAACENDGVKAHYECSRCHKYFDTNKNEIRNLVIDKLGHNLIHHEKLEPTCIEDGHEEYDTCTRCDYTTYKTINKLGHDLVHHERLDATCTSIGYEAYDECSRCDYSTYKEIAKLPHDYKDEWSYDENGHYHECKNCNHKENESVHSYTWIIDVEPTEDATGTKHEECSVCHSKRNENTLIEKLDHKHQMEHVSRKEATCEEDGNIEYYHCIKCNKNYEDENGNKLLYEVVIKASHNYGTWIAEIPATCEQDGIKGHYECSRCHKYFNNNNKKEISNLVINKLGHDLTHHERLEATCTSVGHEAYDECSRCDYSTYKEIAKLPHDYKDEWSYDENGHYHECKNCNHKENESVHSYTWIIDVEPTEDATGTKHEECSVCHSKRNENTLIEKLDHKHQMEHVSRKEATCEEDGNIEYYHCIKCNKNYKDENGSKSLENIIINVTGHSYGTWIEEVSATCENNGIKGHYECSSCHKYFDTNKNEINNLVINNLGHNLAHYDKLNPTCTEDGYEAYEECSRCDYTTYKTINKLGHNLIHYERLEATCTSIGHEAYEECSRCDYTTYKEIAKKPHDYKVEWSHDENSHYHECKNCDATSDVTNHTFTWIIDKDSTCKDEGLKHEECEVCHYTRNENTVIELKEHTIVTDKAVEATCTSTGLTEGKHCSVCNEVLVKQEVVAKKEHAFGEWHVVKEATTKEDGKEERTCSSCNTTESRSIAKITKKGCKGNMATSIITLITCLGLLICFRKEKN